MSRLWWLSLFGDGGYGTTLFVAPQLVILG
jgi:hypothetical protein